MATPPSQPAIQEIIPADSIDTVPVLSALLARLSNLSTTNPTSPTSPSFTTFNGGPPLSIKDIPAATDELKHKLQKARAQVKQLPDIDRTMDEQQEEIRELEEKIEAQRKVLQGLRDVGLAAMREKEERETMTVAGAASADVVQT